MGGMGGLMGLLPGVAKVKKQLEQAKVGESMLAHQEAIIASMTSLERRNPKCLNASRRRRIALGSGTSVQEVNRLIKQFTELQGFMKRAGKLGEKGLKRAGLPGLPPGLGGVLPR